MELYGRPAVTRRNTTPNVLFLNEPKPRPSASAFAPPTVRGHEKDAVIGIGLHVAGERTAVAPPPTESTLFHHTRPPPSARPIERPQSGGVRRPAPGAISSGPTQLKQRPSTARESSRTVRLPSSNDSEALFTSRWVSSSAADKDRGPEEEEPEEKPPEIRRDPQPSGGSPATRDEEYIRQLKADILHCHQLLASERGFPSSSSSSFSSSSSGIARSHTHVKNVQSMRESRAAETSIETIHAQLQRYNYSSDATQLQSAKAKLEGILSECVTQLMRHFLELRDDVIHDEPEDSETEREQAERPQHPLDTAFIGLKRPPGQALAFTNGCGADAASIYAGGMLGVLQRAERFRTAIVGLHAEKSILRKTVDDKSREVDKLKEEVDLFKDALAKSMSKRSSEDSGLRTRPRTSRGDEVSDLPLAKAVRGPESDLQMQLEHAAQLSALEKERIRLENTIVQLSSDKEALARQVREARQELEHQTISAAASRTALEKALEQAARDAHEKMVAHQNRERELQNALAALTDKCRRDEEAAAKEKQSLRSDNQALEMRLRKVEDELRATSALLGQKTDVSATLKRTNERVETLTVQLKAAEQKVVAATREADALRNERGRESIILTQIRRELEAATTRIEDLTRQLQQATATQTSQQTLLRQAELKLTQAHAEVERQASIAHHHVSQVQQLEAKLSRSISVDEDELTRRQQLEETAWHQKLTAVEHLLAVERQHSQSLKDQHAAALTAERERAAHAASQATTIAIELEAANLCLAERKKQRDREQTEFDHQKQQLLDRIASLMAELESQRQQRRLIDQRDHEREAESLKQQLTSAKEELTEAQRNMKRREEQLREEYESKQREMSARDQREVDRFKAAAENALQAEVEIRQQLEVMEEERDLLMHRLQGVSSPRGGPSALSEARVELQKAKLKIAALEEKMNKGESSRGKDVDGKMAQLALRERRLGDDQKALKKLKQELSAEKKQLKATQDVLETERAAVDADRAKNQDEHKLLRQIITALASRLALQMQLLGVIPPELAASSAGASHGHGRQRVGGSGSSCVDFLAKFQREQPENWRKIQLKWEQLQQELDDADWQLVHMRHRLEELNLDGASPPASRPKTPILSAFSDAVAAGRDTVPVAEQLQTSVSKPVMAVPPPPVAKEDAVALAARVRQEEQETFAIAMAKEMRAMKDSYEAKMDELQAELRRTQKLRVESTHKLRAELDDEKRRSQQIISQLSDKCALLEAQLQALQRAFTELQDAQIAALQAYDSASTEAAKAQAMQALLRVVQDACAQERCRRETLEKERVRKLLDYCGSSSVSVEREDKAAARML